MHAGGNGASANGSRRRAYFPETGLLEVEVHDRGDLRVGQLLDGPCLVAETTTTTVVLPDDRVEMTHDGSLLVHVRAGE
jgi:N-methylhydantoinase A